MRLSSALAIVFCWIFFCLTVGLYHEKELIFETTITNVTIQLEQPTKWYRLEIAMDSETDTFGVGLEDVKTGESFNVITLDDGAETLYLGSHLGVAGEIYLDSITVSDDNFNYNEDCNDDFTEYQFCCGTSAGYGPCD